MNWIKTTFKWCYRTFWYTVVGLIITLAIAISLFRVYLPDIKEHREEIEAFASEVLKQDVRIKSMDAKLSGFTPLIIFDEVYLLDTHSKKEIVHFDQARLTIDLFRSLFKMEVVPDSFTIIGVDLGVKRRSDGNFSIQGLDIDELGKQIPLTTNQEESDELATWFFKRSKLAIKDSRIVFQRVGSGNNTKSIQFDNVNFFLRNDGERHQLNGAVTLPAELGRDLEMAFDFSGNILNPSEWFGKVFYKAEDLNLVNWGVKPEFMNSSLEQGTLDMELWGDWEQGSITSFTADIKANNFILNIGKQKKPFSVQQLTGLVDWRKDGQGWKLNVKDFIYNGKNEAWPTSSVAVQYFDDKRIKAYSSFLRLDDIKQALIEGEVLDQTFQSTLVKIDPKGDLRNVFLSYSFDEKLDQYSLSTNFSDLTINPWKKIPGIEDITGKVWLNEKLGSIELASKETRLLIPEMFRAPFKASSVNGQVDWFFANKVWNVTSDEIVVLSPDMNVDLGFSLLLPEDGSSPYIDLQASYENGDATQAHKYFPASIMSKKLLSWLDNAFRSGTVTTGGVVLNGRLDDFPYKDYSGTLLADFDMKDAELAYQAGWPNLMVKDVNLEISGLGLSAKSKKSRIYNSDLLDVDVAIESFATPILMASSNMQGRSSDLAKFLIESPIAPNAKKVVDQTRILGKASGSGAFQLPLSKATSARSPLNYDIKVQLHNNEFNAWQGSLVAKNITGDLRVSPKGVFSDDIQFDLLGGQSRAKLYTTNINKLQDYRLSMHGKIDTSKISQHVDLSMLSKINGKTDWQGILAIGNKESPGYFQFVSKLNGVELKLPAPLEKVSDTEKSFNVLVQFPEQDKLPVNIKYGDELSSALVINLDKLDSEPFEKGEIIFSFAREDTTFIVEKPKLPEKNELVVRGRLQEFHVDDWLKLIRKDAGKKNVGITTLNIPIRLDMDYLKVVTREDEETEVAEKDPRKISAFDADIRTLFYNDTDLGHVRFKMDRHEDGLEFKELLIDSPYMHVEGEGSWLLRDGKHLTNLLVIGATDDLGVMLSRLGFSAVIQKGTAKAVIQANWYDSPDNFSLEKLNGNVGIIVNDGVLSDVKPGAGRLLGLFSLTELPRRLLLDFSELKEGFAFKQIVGQFEIKDGDAFADTLKIISPIALINIEGRTGLATRDFNQLVSVAPRISDTLPVISWLAWGGQIGALAFLLDQLFGDEFNSSVATEYEITGSWDNPQIKKIEKIIPEANQTDEDEEEEEYD